MSDDRDISGPGEESLLAAEYVLGVLPPAEYAAAGQLLRTHAGFQADYRFWRNRLATLDSQFAETPAPARVWTRIEQRLFASPSGQRSLWNSIGFWRSLSAAAALVAVVAIGVNVATPRPDPNAFAAQIVAALSAQGSNVSVVALYNASTGHLRLTTLSGDAVPDKDYELWAIEGTNAPKSMGVFPINQRVDMKLTPEEIAGLGPGTTLAISLEPKGGSTTGAPTGPVVAAGQAKAI